MKKLIKLFIAPLTWLLQACSPLGKPIDIEISNNFYYNKSQSDIIYSSMGNWFELGKTPLGADAESFEILNAQLGRDKDQAYYKWHSIPNTAIDLNTFDASYADWMWHIGMDKDRVYSFSDDVIDGEWQLVMHIIEGADPDTFKNIDYKWAKDKNNHFYEDKIISVAYESFEVINDTFAKDKDSVYLHYQGRFESIDAETEGFKKIDKYYARDTKHVYYFQDYAKGEKIELLKKFPYEKLRTVKVFEESYLVVDQSLYYRGILIEEANSSRLKVLSSEIAKDDQHVYYQDVQIEGADPASFVWDDQKFVYRDKHRTYNNEELTKRTGSDSPASNENETSS